jgi:alkylhydroperoxidase family enzyme
MVNSLKPLVEPYSAEVAAALSHYPQQDGYVLTLFRTFANSLRFLRKAVPNLLDRESPLTLRMREIVILRTTANLGCEYEWGVHVAAFGSAAKLSEQQLCTTRSPQIDEILWTPEEVGLIAAIDQLCADGRMTDATQSRFEAQWTLEQQLEILALCGTYHTISYVANTAKLDAEPFAARFPTRLAPDEKSLSLL